MLPEFEGNTPSPEIISDDLARFSQGDNDPELRARIADHLKFTLHIVRDAKPERFASPLWALSLSAEKSDQESFVRRVHSAVVATPTMHDAAASLSISIRSLYRYKERAADLAWRFAKQAQPADEWISAFNELKARR